MRVKCLGLFILLFLLREGALAQGTVPTFTQAVAQSSYTFAGNDPATSGTTTIPTVLVPIRLSFQARKIAGRPLQMDAGADVSAILHSPIFAKHPFPSGGNTQYTDALLRTSFPETSGWHTLLGSPEVKPLEIEIPSAYGYVLTSQKSGRSVAIADLEYIQQKVFSTLPKQEGKLVIAVTHNTSFYAAGDATVCCSWGSHGVDKATGNSFVIASFLQGTPDVVMEKDVQPLTEQLGEFVLDPLHDTYIHGYDQYSGNKVPSWMRLDGEHCGGSGIGSSYFLLDPTDINPKNNIPSSKAFLANTRSATYHLQNVALLPWYLGATANAAIPYSFPDKNTLTTPAKACGSSRNTPSTEPAVSPLPAARTANGHLLLGYTGGNTPIAPQWDIVLIAFASPDKNAPEGTLKFNTPRGMTTEEFKAKVASLKSQGKKVLLSLGGGGQFFTLTTRESLTNFVSSTTAILQEYGFQGVDIDFETPSLVIDPGDKDFKHPTTPSIEDLIQGLRQLHDHFGADFMISLVPEGPQVPAGFSSYGGQFGSYLPIEYALRDILSFIDVQDYNTPPIQGLDGEIYQAGTVDYHAAVTELLLQGFAAGGDRNHFFPAVPQHKVAVGFLYGDTTPTIVKQSMHYLITGKAPAGTHYKLRRPQGYPGMIGAMFWTLDDDRKGDYKFSNTVGPQLHSYPKAH